MTEEVSATPVPPPAGETVSAAAAVAGIFTRPGATFSALIRRPTWWLPFVAGALLAREPRGVLADLKENCSKYLSNQ